MPPQWNDTLFDIIHAVLIHWGGSIVKIMANKYMDTKKKFPNLPKENTIREPVLDVVELLVLTTSSFFDGPESFDKFPPLNK